MTENIKNSMLQIVCMYVAERIRDGQWMMFGSLLGVQHGCNRSLEVTMTAQIDFLEAMISRWQ